MAFIKVYQQYVNNYDKSLQTKLELQRNNSQFLAWQKQVQKSPELGGDTLESLLIMPVQVRPFFFFSSSSFSCYERKGSSLMLNRAAHRSLRTPAERPVQTY